MPEVGRQVRIRPFVLIAFVDSKVFGHDSVRAWRGLRYNERYAAKLEKKKAKRRAEELAEAKMVEEEAERRRAAKTNPFSINAPSSPPNPFGLGSQIFGQSASDASETGQEETDKKQGDKSDTEDEDGDDEDEYLVTAMAANTLKASEWASTPAYEEFYLSTTTEYVPPASKEKTPKNTRVDQDDTELPSKDATWALEGYENSLDVDHAFERFSQRVGYEGEQCLRYDFGGTPLPFASDKIFDRLFPVPPKPNMPVTKPVSMVVPVAKRVYDPSSIPTCPHCKCQRVFECQLMPNLINILKSNDDKKEKDRQMTEEERKKEVEKVLKGGGDINKAGMEWGTCMIFTCGKDCCVENGSGAKNCWREEIVLVQWDV